MIKKAKITLDGYFNYGNVFQRYVLYQVLSFCVNDVVEIMFKASGPQLKFWRGWQNESA